jgi:glycosyltransferase involved in cell wall biosynthesis
MRIGINVCLLWPGTAGGMEWYVRCLLDQLARLDRDNDYLLVTAPHNDHTFRRLGRRWAKVVYRGDEAFPDAYRQRPEARAGRGRWYEVPKRVYRRLRGTHVPGWEGGLADLLARRRIDLWFCPLMYALPVDAGVPVVNTIPDLQHEYYPEFLPADELARRRLGYQYSCRAAGATVAISGSVADDIVRLYGVPAAKVLAIPLALDPFMEQAGADGARLAAEVRSKYGLDREFVFYPANGWPHKNHEALVRAMGLVARERPGLQLVLSGCPFDLPGRVEPILEEHGLRGAVRHLGYVSRADVAGLHAASAMLVFPSLFEGFGLPLLEAMHLGAPVACSRIGSLPEVGGAAARYFDPRSERQIADAILAVTGDRALRRQLAEAGREQVARFSYARTAAETLALFRRVGAGRLPPPDVPPLRPLAPGRLLERGLGRWLFRLRDVRQLRLEVVPGGKPPQHLEVRLDGRTLLDAPLDGRPVCRFVLPAAAGQEFHTLEVSASTRSPSGPGQTTVQLLSLVAVSSADQELRLVA